MTEVGFAWKREIIELENSKRACNFYTCVD